MSDVVVVIGQMAAVQPHGEGRKISLLRIDPNSPINGEHITASLRESRGTLISGRWYRVTYEEIPAPNIIG